jgi:hypothetical protein
MTSQALHRTFAAIAVVVVGTAVVWGFVVVGSPGTERRRKIDERRVDDLRAIENAVRELCVVHDGGSKKLRAPLPATLDDLVERASREGISRYRYGGINITDPESGEAYGYRITGEAKFELCATFSLPRDNRKDPWWDHSTGTHCYTVDLLAP